MHRLFGRPPLTIERQGVAVASCRKRATHNNDKEMKQVSELAMKRSYEFNGFVGYVTMNPRTVSRKTSLFFDLCYRRSIIDPA